MFINNQNVFEHLEHPVFQFADAIKQQPNGNIVIRIKFQPDSFHLDVDSFPWPNDPSLKWRAVNEDGSLTFFNDEPTLLSVDEDFGVTHNWLLASEVQDVGGEDVYIEMTGDNYKSVSVVFIDADNQQVNFHFGEFENSSEERYY